MSTGKGVLTGKVRRTLLGVVLFLVAVLLGLGSAWWVLKKAPSFQQMVQVGAWKTNLLAGSADAGMYTRAAVALNALLALDRSETMYFMATQDDAGQGLRSTCNFRSPARPCACCRRWAIPVCSSWLSLPVRPIRQQFLQCQRLQHPQPFLLPPQPQNPPPPL